MASPFTAVKRRWFRGPGAQVLPSDLDDLEDRIEAATAGAPVLVRKTANQTVNNSTVLVNDNHLFIPAQANEVWAVELFALLTTPSATPKWKAGRAGPAGASGALYASANDYNASLNPNPLGGTFNFNVMVAGDSAARIKGVITLGATPGNIILQWAQSVATAEDTKVLANSVLIGYRLT